MTNPITIDSIPISSSSKMMVSRPTGSSSSMIQVVNPATQTIFHNTLALKDLGPFNFFLGIEVHRSTDGSKLLGQGKYIQDLLDRAKMLNAKTTSTPMITSSPLSTKMGDHFENVTLYRSIVDALHYVTITRPEIYYSVNKPSSLDLMGYSDVDWGMDPDDKRSTSVIVFFLVET
ncbi:Retrovirus-related Pol polyprotein from transposon RE1 [Vitis vinifera]|uniref:Retrovirus-related Pol polyprotein from transposon RE1 n=1 Tax=Vitis vinifera TaxID=29760 RepID=A0A438K580_VITVI|nr:Retrovirus-related Pol polyprotein from transposon RE1 [Vitis vinifera]